MRILTTLFLFLINNSFSQNSSFEGILKYRIIKSEIELISMNETNVHVDTTYLFLLIKEDNLIQVYDSISNFNDRLLYNQKDCLMYQFENGILKSFYTIENDYFIGDFIISDTLKDSIINDTDCFGLVLENQDHEYYKYFSKNIFLKSNQCSKNIEDNLSKYILYFQESFLKTLSKKSNKTIVQLIDIQYKKLDNQLFTVPNKKDLHITKE